MYEDLIPDGNRKLRLVQFDSINDFTRPKTDRPNANQTLERTVFRTEDAGRNNPQ